MGNAAQSGGFEWPILGDWETEEKAFRTAKDSIKELLRAADECGLLPRELIDSVSHSHRIDPTLVQTTLASLAEAGVFEIVENPPTNIRLAGPVKDSASQKSFANYPIPKNDFCAN